MGKFGAKGRSDVKEKKDCLGTEQRDILKSSPCYLCDMSPPTGIDRVDPAGHYDIDDVQPCCAMCNYMKKDMKLQEFLDHITQIYCFTAQWVL